MGFLPTCWDFSESEYPSIPVLPILIKNPLNKSDDWMELFIKVDTGFSGTLGLPHQIIQDLNLTLVGQTNVKSATGQSKSKMYQAHIMSNEWELPESVTYVIETKRGIIGRSILIDKNWLLNFKTQQFCYLKEG